MERKESQRTRAAGRRRPLESRRPPVAAILILVAFVFLILVFVTSRQMAGAKAHRLRLLAGFGERVSITIPDIAERFASIIQEHKDPESIATYIEAVPRLALVAVISEKEAPGGIEGARLSEAEIGRFHAIGPSLTLSGEGGIVELVYVGRPGQKPPKAADEEAGTTPRTPSRDTTIGESESGSEAEEGAEEAAAAAAAAEEEEEEEPAPVTKFVGRIDVVPVLDRILIPEIFDSVLIASGSDGQVFHQSGEPELAVADIEPLLARATPPLLLADTGATVLTETKIANAGGLFREGAYRLFLQPISLRPPDLAGRIHVESEPWVACGLISEQNLLASSFTTSPLLLFILVISFPSALIAWPFLKLVFISPRQRMTRFDVGALLFSSLLALSLGTLLIFDLLYVARVDGEVDRQLRTLAETVEDNLRQELLAMHLQLNRVDDAVRLVGRDASEAALVSAAPTTTIHLPPAVSSRPLREEGELMQRLVERHADKLSDYPFFHSVFWADREGDQIGKLALREPAILTNNVYDRDYYKCARDTGTAGRYALRFEEEDLRRFLRERGRLDGRRPTLAALGYPEGREPRDGHIEFCLEPIVSKTTGQDLVVLSLETGDSGRPVMALTTQLLSLAHPLLPNGYGLAVVDGTGRAVFHSDRRRNQTENFLKASDQDRLLRSLLEHQRQGAVTLNYWGRRHRLHLRPLDGLPWTAIAYRSKGDLRVRNFELVYDFMNAFLPYAALVFFASFFGIRWRWLRRKLLWPDSANRGVYRLAALVAVAGTGVFALVLVLGGIRTVFFASYLLPAVFVGLLLLAVLFRDRLRELMEVQAAPGGPWWWRRRGTAEEEAPAELAPEVLVCRPSRLAVWSESIAFGLGVGGALLAAALSRGFVTVFLLLLVAVAAAFWLFRRSYFVGKQRQLAYTFALTSFLFVTAVLPAVGFFRLAAQRQLQFLVQETQEELARSLESHEGALRSARGPWAPTGGRDGVIDGMRRAHLKSFFATELEADDAEADRATARQDRLWPAGRAATREPLHLRMLTSRLVPLNELSSEIHGVDLSRFEAVRPEWELAGEPARLFGTFRRSWGTGGSIRLASTRFSDFTGDIQPFRALLLGGLLLIVVGSPGVLGRFLAHRVLLVRLVRSRRTPTVNDLLGALRPQEDEERSWLFSRARVLLVTSIPELAVQEADGERFEVVDVPDWEAEDQDELEAGEGDERQEQPAGDERTGVGEPGAPPSTAVAAVERGGEERGGSAGEGGDAAGPGNGDAVVDRRARLIAGFVPSLDDRDLLRRQVSWLRTMLEERRRAVVLVSASSFSTILRLRREATSHSGLDEMEPEVRDLVSLLASFVAQFAADSQEGNGQTSGLERLVRYRRQQFDPWYRPPQEAKPATDDEPAQEARSERRSNDPLLRRRHRLLDVVLEECLLNKQLQRAGLQAIREVLEDDACTETQLVSQIGYLAAPYYEALWASCGVDEKVVLVQLAHEGLVNPKNLDTVLDLLQKGLVVRDPELRPMNRSFARFVTRAVRPAEVAAWEEEIGTSSWSVLKWLLPLPLLLLGGFLFLTQQDAFSNVIGLVIAIGSVVPTLVNLFDQFQRLSSRRIRAAEAGAAD